MNAEGGSKVDVMQKLEARAREVVEDLKVVELVDDVHVVVNGRGVIEMWAQAGSSGRDWCKTVWKALIFDRLDLGAVWIEPDGTLHRFAFEAEAVNV